MKWTDERKAWFRAFVPGHTEREISAEHERVFGVPLTEGQIGNAKTKLGVKSGTKGGCFAKGAPPSNKGKKWDDYLSKDAQARCRATQFRKGDVPANGKANPLGTERVDKDGYVWVKVAETKIDPKSAHDNWKMKHRLVYEQAHGSVPDGCNIVFADHDNRNFDPANLVAAPRDVWSVISRTHMQYCDAETLEACVNVARLSRALHAARMMPRSCKPVRRRVQAAVPEPADVRRMPGEDMTWDGSFSPTATSADARWAWETG